MAGRATAAWNACTRMQPALQAATSNDGTPTSSRCCGHSVKQTQAEGRGRLTSRFATAAGERSAALRRWNLHAGRSAGGTLQGGVHAELTTHMHTVGPPVPKPSTRLLQAASSSAAVLPLQYRCYCHRAAALTARILRRWGLQTAR